MLIKSPKGWELPERIATPESAYANRRDFLKKLGFSGLGIWGLTAGCSGESSAQNRAKNVRQTLPKAAPPYPAKRNPAFSVERPETPERLAASYNNFYEFTTMKDQVWQLAHDFKTKPWQIEISGEVEKPRTIDLDDLLKALPLEERVYRFRCVEAWSMVVPWTGIKMKDFVEWAQPTSKAKYIRFVTFLDKKNAPGQRTNPWYPWPYFEGLRMDEATNELAMLATGSYGHRLPNQHGAPVRVITPWKYGFKSIKSIVKIEFITEKPSTFWSEIAPSEYTFWANVEPNVPHPRWSQATERDIATGDRIPTLPYNGYAKYVSKMY